MRVISASLALITLAALSACDVDQTKEGDLPEVNVSGGQLPEYDVDVANVSVGTTNEQIEVPTIETETRNVQVPTIDVEQPKD
jgi:hypothetical protein